jgi:hypothetical protein
MKRMEMEMAIKECAEKISESQLIQKCIQIAQKFGKGGHTSEEWANAKLIFDKGPLKIDYETYAMGDRELRVHYSGEEVFGVKEKVNDYAKYPNPELKIGRDRFEILCYKSGDWELMVESIIRKMNEEVGSEEVENVRNRFGIALSK